jgi:catechol 2,3-dioxygenase-like lactoylglutathione lyase family enzyme
MRVEHIAFQVKDPAAVADWYLRNLGFQVARLAGGPANTHFLADAAGVVVLEIYNNAAVPQPDYASMHPLIRDPFGLPIQLVRRRTPLVAGS